MIYFLHTFVLHDRKLFVKIENVKSDMKVFDYGVPQGSVLGPLLFLLYLSMIFLHVHLINLSCLLMTSV